MGKPEKTADAARLEWTVSPWAVNWKRPARALAMCMIMALLACFSLNYPNYSIEDQPAAGAEAVDDQGVETADDQSVETADDKGMSAEELQAYRDNWVGRSLVWSLFSMLFLVGMTATVYLPVRYRLDDKGVTTVFLGVPTTRPWKHYRNYYLHDTGIHLTTMLEPSPLDPFRGHYIQFGKNRDEVKAFVEARVKRPEKKAKVQK